MSSCSPSSSAVTIPTPGKSILKRPPHSQQSLFARFTKFLPVAAPQPDDDHVKPLKRAHFILPEIAIVYPISSVNPPSTPALKDEKRAIEDRELERRRRVVRGPPSSPGAEPEGWWNMDKVASFYRECCAGYDEEPDPAISAAFKLASHTVPRTVDLSGVQLTPTSASVLSDVFTIDWGLRKIVFRECDLDDLTLKPILHSLLISGSVSFLSVASNRRLKAPAFRLIGAYMKKSQALRFLDLAQNFLDKKSIEYIVAALESPPEQGLDSLRLDDCSLRPAALEALCRAVRTSSLKHISLRHNRISSSGGVALALMIRDYPDTMPILMSPTPSNSGTPVSSTTSSPSQSVIGLPPPSPLASHSHPPLPPIPPPTKAGPVLPPPRHPSQGPVQTTYTPYIPKGRRRVNVNPPPPTPTGQHIPIITSSSQGGVTTRHTTIKSSQHSTTSSLSTVRHDTGPSAALLDRVRALDALPRLGALKTLDLKGNDLRNGITYLAQVLKRNRTLKLLNLSENKLDVVGLVTIAEALKYNSCLETLDMSKNPCSGPSLDGIQSLRTAFTLNSSLKRLFLSSTQMSSAGAIALAEFLPESTSLLHLDLTSNELDLAGVMALNSGLKGNHVMRCLDLNIPPADEKYAKMCREILNTCVRNTEEAEKNSKMASFEMPSSAVSETTPISAAMKIVGGGGGGGGRQKKGVWGLIEDSELAKSIRKDEQKKMENDVVTRAKVCIVQLSKLNPSSPIPPPPPPSSPSPSPLSSTTYSPATTPTMETPKMSMTRQQSSSLEQLTTMSGAIIVELRKAIQEEMGDSERLGDLLSVNDQLVSVLTRVGGGGEGGGGRGGSGRRPKLVLQGLGLSIEGRGEEGVVVREGEGEKKDLGGGVGDDEFPISGGGGEVGNGDVNGIVDGVHEHGVEEEEEDVETPTTPRIDKGKGRAAPEEEEEEEPEKVLSPSYVIDSEDEREDGYGVPEDIAALTSPTERSRSWVEEEGEIFRKGNVLLGPEELEGEYAGEDLRKELLEAMVERPPPRPILDDFGMESILGQGANVDLVDPFSVAPGSPALHSVGGTPTSFNHAHAGMHSPTTSTTTMDQGQGQKSPLGTSTRPYVPRRSSNSIMGVMASPALSGSNNNNDNDNNNNGIQASSSSSSSSSTLAAPVMSSGESPNLLSQVPTFVKRKKSTDGDYFSSAT